LRAGLRHIRDISLSQQDVPDLVHALAVIGDPQDATTGLPALYGGRSRRAVRLWPRTGNSGS
jgi:hypothetical protein